MIRRCAFVFLLITQSLHSAEPNPPIQPAFDRIAAFHAGETPNDAAIQVVYFHAADREPLLDFQARLGRILRDISDFYREGMARRFSVKTNGLPFSQENGQLKIHVVRGKQHELAFYCDKNGVPDAKRFIDDWKHRQ